MKSTISTTGWTSVIPAMLVSLVVAAALAMAGCASNGSRHTFDRSDTGRVIGGIAGAAAGTQIGDGSGRTVAIIAGALIGSAVGERIGANMENEDLRQTAWALEDNRTGESAAWVNPDTGNHFSVTPTATYERNGYPCREFDFRVETSRGSELQERTACRKADGTWEVVG